MKHVFFLFTQIWALLSVQSYIVTQNPFFGRARGLLGGLVATTWQGLNVWKTKPETVRQPNSQAQIDQKFKFSLIQAFCSASLQIMRIGFKFFVQGQTPYNESMSRNLKYGISGASPDFTRKWDALLISEGVLNTLETKQITGWNVDNVTLTWTDNSGQGNALATDKIRVLATFETSDISTKVKAVIVETTRTDATISFAVPEEFAGEVGHIYAFFESADGTKISDTIYFGTGEYAAAG